MIRRIRQTGLLVKLMVFVPQTKPSKWCDVFGICGLDSEDRTLFHPEICGLQDEALEAGTLYLARLQADALCPLVTIQWAKESFPERALELGIFDERIRHLATSGIGETKELLALENSRPTDKPSAGHAAQIGRLAHPLTRFLL